MPKPWFPAPLCAKCGKEERTNYPNCPNTYCKSCLAEKHRKWYRSHPYDANKMSTRNRKHNYGITKEEYDLMFFRQAGLCAICGEPETVIDPYTKKPKALGVDHNHLTRDIRALLCNACNHAVGYLEKDRTRYKKALNYLKIHDR